MSERVSNWLAERRARAADANELRALAEAGDERALVDIGLEAGDIARLVNPRTATLLPEMMARIGLSQGEARVAGCRDIERTCAMCEAWRRCEAALAVGTAEETWREFCPNAPIFAEAQTTGSDKGGME